ncbi:hypothetical protein FACS1894204_08190 [Synergistales bacterium]|nr:hypothetical protein FACS1894204_08190 [Synergistales bacterium]
MNSFYPVEVQPLEYYKLLVTFDNSERRMFDVNPYLDDDFFKPLKDVNVFNSVKVNSISIDWGGNIDICPDELYYNSVPYSANESLEISQKRSS